VGELDRREGKREKTADVGMLIGPSLPLHKTSKGKEGQERQRLRQSDRGRSKK